MIVIADIPYNLGNNAYASNPSWYEGGENIMRRIKCQREKSLKNCKI